MGKVQNHTLRIVIAYGLSASLAIAADVTTVPWNGYAGAVSFTYDDAQQTQLDNVVPALKQRNIHATFFIYDVGGTFTNNKSKWVAAAKDGNELANHSVNHADFSKTIDAAYEVSDMATRLRNADPSIQANTFAYPYCAIGYKTQVQNENIIGRGCLFGGTYNPLKWSSPPSDWNNVGAVYIGDDATAKGGAMTALDAAKNGGWIATLAHGVGGGVVPISIANNNALFDRAIQNKLWVGTYMEVAAYWRAGLTMDTVHAVATSTGWNLVWKSPHPKMPKSVPLKIRLNESTFGKGISLLQKGTAISANSDGSYTVEFMSLELTIQKAGSTSSVSISSSSSVLQTAYSSATIPGKIEVENYDAGNSDEAFSDSDAGNSGNVYRQDDVDLDLIEGSNYTLGWTIAGEWLEYTVNVPQKGIYEYKARVAAGLDSSAFHLELDGSVITPSIIVPNTGDWKTFQEVSGTLGTVESGLHVLRLVIDKSYCNIDWIEFQEPVVKIGQKQFHGNSQKRSRYKVYDLRGNPLKDGSSLSSPLPRGTWIVVEEDDRGTRLSSRVTVQK